MVKIYKHEEIFEYIKTHVFDKTKYAKFVRLYNKAIKELEQELKVPEQQNLNVILYDSKVHSLDGKKCDMMCTIFKYDYELKISTPLKIISIWQKGNYITEVKESRLVNTH